MVAAVDHRYRQIHHFVAREDAGLHRFLHAVFDGRNEFPRNRAAENLVDEQQPVLLVEAPLAALARHLLRELVEFVGRHLVHVFVRRHWAAAAR